MQRATKTLFWNAIHSRGTHGSTKSPRLPLNCYHLTDGHSKCTFSAVQAFQRRLTSNLNSTLNDRIKISMPSSSPPNIPPPRGIPPVVSRRQPRKPHRQIFSFKFPKMGSEGLFISYKEIQLPTSTFENIILDALRHEFVIETTTGLLHPKTNRPPSPDILNATLNRLKCLGVWSHAWNVLTWSLLNTSALLTNTTDWHVKGFPTLDKQQYFLNVSLRTFKKKSSILQEIQILLPLLCRA